MKVDVAPTIEAIIQEQIESGQYRDASDVVGQAVRLLAARNQEHAELLESLEEALEELRQGGGVEYTPELRRQMWEAAMRGVERGDVPNKDVMP